MRKKKDAIQRPVERVVIRDLYFVGGIEREHDLNVLGRPQKLPLTWADNMIGVLPVFSDRESAERYANGKLTVCHISAENNVSV